MAAARLGLDGQVKELRLGLTFNKNYKEGAYHTIRYDFKPASMDKQKMGNVEVEGNHQVSVTVPHVDGAGTSQTVFKGNHKPVARECILIIDHKTGEIVLERISQTINLKTTRPEVSSRMSSQRPTTPLDPISRKNSPPQKCSPGHMPSRGSGASHSRPSPSHNKNSPSKSSPHARLSPNANLNMPGSMPLLGFDDNGPSAKDAVMSESSSDSESNSSSSSSSDSDSDSEGDQEAAAPKKANGHGDSAPASAPASAASATSGNISNGPNCLMDDLDLSSVSEDSD